MKESVQNDIINAIERSQRILVITHRKPDGDAIGSLMAISKTLLFLGKEVTAVCSDKAPESFSFFPDIGSLRNSVPNVSDFVVILDCDKTEVDRLKYHLEGNRIHIVITPKKGKFSEKNVSFQKGGDTYDLIIAVDVADQKQLGKLFEENPAMFANAPLINIDHHPSNPGFGKINCVDIGASSTSEILYGLIRQMETRFKKKLITPEVATYLLSGITTDTGSFQNSNTTPKSMETAATLMDSGAAQQDIIKYLFRTKKFTTLKLWGNILRRVEVDKTHRLVWSTMTKEDVVETGANPEDSNGIIDELLVHAPEAEIVAFFKEEPDMVTVSLRSKTPNADVMEIAEHFGGGGHVQASGIKFPKKNLAEIQSQIIHYLQEYQKKRLGLETGRKDEPKITQVLEGYTTPDVVAEKTLEEKVTRSPAIGGGIQTSPPAGASHATQEQDIHEKTKAAITAEQSQPTTSSAAPSKFVGKSTAIPKKEKRFTDDMPSFLTKPPVPSPSQVSPPPQPKAGQPVFDGGIAAGGGTVGGVKVTPATTVKPPEIPQNSKPPEVRVIGSAGATGTGTSVGAATPPKPPTPPTPPPTATGSSDASLKGSPGASPPKDPFAIGDDGLTDIERALGGL